MGLEPVLEYIGYLIKSAVRSSKLRRTINWKQVPGTVHHTHANDGDVETVYTYQFEGGYYSGSDTRDFFWTHRGEEYVSRFPDGAATVLRVNPSNPEQIAFRDDDQGL